jgi:hypothetical protein
MIPNIEILTQEITDITYPSRTYKINFFANMEQQNGLNTVGDSALTITSSNKLTGFTIDDNGVVSISYNAQLAGYNLTQDSKGILNLSMSADVSGMDRISGYIDDIDAVIQTIYLILSIERYEFIIYSWDYGVELVDLFGKPMPYVISELPRRIKEALIQDDRILDVVDFEFERNGKRLHTTFNVISTVGNISTALEVGI